MELLYKGWKQHGQLDVSRAAKPWRVLTEVLAKLLGLLVQYWVAVTGCWADPARSLVKAAQTVRAHALHLLSALRSGPQLRRALSIIHLDPALQSLG